jgi:hypothetical protein
MLNAWPEGLVIREVGRNKQNRSNNGMKEIGPGAYPAPARATASSGPEVTRVRASDARILLSDFKDPRRRGSSAFRVGISDIFISIGNL